MSIKDKYHILGEGVAGLIDGQRTGRVRIKDGGEEDKGWWRQDPEIVVWWLKWNIHVASHQ